jgi:hypothetical protein
MASKGFPSGMTSKRIPPGMATKERIVAGKEGLLLVMKKALNIALQRNHWQGKIVRNFF